jgi:hypothetical protein
MDAQIAIWCPFDTNSYANERQLLFWPYAASASASRKL